MIPIGANRGDFLYGIRGRIPDNAMPLIVMKLESASTDLEILEQCIAPLPPEFCPVCLNDGWIWEESDDGPIQVNACYKCGRTA